jgi:uncharacterized protein YraI
MAHLRRGEGRKCCMASIAAGTGWNMGRRLRQTTIRRTVMAGSSARAAANCYSRVQVVIRTGPGRRRRVATTAGTILPHRSRNMGRRLDLGIL